MLRPRSVPGTPFHAGSTRRVLSRATSVLALDTIRIVLLRESVCVWVVSRSHTIRRSSDTATRTLCCMPSPMRCLVPRPWVTSANCFRIPIQRIETEIRPKCCVLPRNRSWGKAFGL